MDEHVEMVGLIHSRDITDRKLAGTALQEKERLLSEAQRTGRIGSWSYDIRGDTMLSAMYGCGGIRWHRQICAIYRDVAGCYRTSCGPHRKVWARKDAIEFITAQAGTHFDPLVVECFLKLINKTS